MLKLIFSAIIILTLYSSCTSNAKIPPTLPHHHIDFKSLPQRNLSHKDMKKMFGSSSEGSMFEVDGSNIPETEFGNEDLKEHMKYVEAHKSMQKRVKVGKKEHKNAEQIVDEFETHRGGIPKHTAFHDYKHHEDYNKHHEETLYDPTKISNEIHSRVANEHELTKKDQKKDKKKPKLTRNARFLKSFIELWEKYLNEPNLPEEEKKRRQASYDQEKVTYDSLMKTEETKVTERISLHNVSFDELDLKNYSAKL